MRLINVLTLELVEFSGLKIPPYAILSHTWDGKEVSFQDWQNLKLASQKIGFAKIEGACYTARCDGHDWLWVDTNCIDKSSSAELSEAINSMFSWYAKSEECYAYLSDIPTARTDEGVLSEQFAASRWFTRGWTLQELLAPTRVTFYAADWSKIGSRGGSKINEIAQITGIKHRYLAWEEPITSASVAERMSWASRRTTTREEDVAYCMLGIFDINMPLLYGEGGKAFTRLQEVIIKTSNDTTIFCWSWTKSVPINWTSLLAPSPEAFQYCAELCSKSQLNREDDNDALTYHITNAGLSIQLPVLVTMAGYIIALDCSNVFTTGVDSGSSLMEPWIPVLGKKTKRILYVARHPANPVFLDNIKTRASKAQRIVIKRRDDEISSEFLLNLRQGFLLSTSSCSKRFGVFPIFPAGMESLRDAWVSGFHAAVYGVNVIWFDPENCDTGDIASAVVETSIGGSVNRAAQATVWLAVKVGKDGSTFNWSCQILQRNSELNPAEIKAKLLPYIQQKDKNTEIYIHDDLKLEVEFGDYVSGFGNAQVRVLWVTSNSSKYNEAQSFNSNI